MTETSDATAPWWRRVLDLEPVLVATAVRAIVAVLAAVGILLPGDLEAWTVGLFVAVAAAAEAVLAIWSRLKVTPVVKVVEQVDAFDQVVAGPANDRVATGEYIREHEPPLAI